MNPRKSMIILKYNGKTAQSLANEMSSCTITDCASGQADTISIQVSNKNLKWFKPKWFPRSTDFVKASIKVYHWKGPNDTRTSYQGLFFIDNMSGSGYPNEANLEGISIPIATEFNVTQRNITYKKKSIKKILGEIANRAGIRLVFEASDHSIEEVSQDGKTDMEFAFSLCSDYDLCMKVYNRKLVVYDQTKYERKPAKYTLKHSDLGEDNSYNISRRVAQVYDSVKYQYQDKDGKKITYKFVIPGRKGKRPLFISGQADNHADAEKKAKAALAANLREAVTASFTLLGDPKYKAATVFKLKGFGKFDGRYFIDEVTHSKNDAYMSTIQCHKCVTNIK